MSDDQKKEEWTPAETGDGFYCQSGYGVLGQEPYVQITIRLRDEVRITQISPDNARELALNLLECAEAADMDAIVIRFMQERVHQTLDVAAQVLIDFRELRESLKHKPDGLP